MSNRYKNIKIISTTRLYYIFISFKSIQQILECIVVGRYQIENLLNPKRGGKNVNNLYCIAEKVLNLAKRSEFARNVLRARCQKE